MRLNKTVLIVGLIAGLVAGILASILYSSFVDSWSRPVLIGLLFLIFTLLVGFALFITMNSIGESDESFLFLSSNGLIIAGVVASMMILFGLGALLEVIYEADKSIANQPVSYVFLLDESGSMESNDAECERYNAVNNMVKLLPGETDYAVYMFADDTICVRDMAPVSHGDFVADTALADSIGAGTAIRDGLETVLADIRSGRLSSSGDSIRVILLTDGSATDMTAFIGSRKVIKAYKSAHVSISAVGLGNVDQRLLNKLTEKTGGIYVPIQDATQLTQGFVAATAVDSDRDLLSQRHMTSMNWLYMLLRIIFLTILGGVVAFVKAMACGKEEDMGLILIVGGISALVGSVLVEIVTQSGIAPWLAQMLYFLLLSITPVTVKEIIGGGTNIDFL